MKALIVGCGITGSVIARNLAEAGWQIEIWERRSHIGGNMYDYRDDHGYIVQKYGPHIFHTQDQSLCEYLNKFSEWQDYELKCGAEIDKKCTPMPFNFTTIDEFYSTEKAEQLKKAIKNEFGDRGTVTVIELLSARHPEIRQYAQFLYEKDYKLYTAKQWGISPDKIDSSVLRRVPVRLSYEEGYFEDPYQMMPKRSYTDFFVNLLDHPNISVKLNIDALTHLHVSEETSEILLNGTVISYPVIYTGALDELFNLVEGALPYRSLKFEWYFSDKDSIQDYAVVAYPQESGYTRITEFKKLQPQKGKGSSYAKEFPIPYDKSVTTEPYYPIPTNESAIQYAKYREKAQKVSNLFCCGRLADFKYYNMDQALRRALNVSVEIIEKYQH